MIYVTQKKIISIEKYNLISIFLNKKLCEVVNPLFSHFFLKKNVPIFWISCEWNWPEK